jgi:hypothetical protein
MKNDELTVFNCSIAVAIQCTACDRPPAESVTPEGAAKYIQSVLELALATSGMEVKVTPLVHPVSSKIPLIITVFGWDQLLFWYYPNADTTVLAEELEGVLYEFAVDLLCIPA